MTSSQLLCNFCAREDVASSALGRHHWVAAARQNLILAQPGLLCARRAVVSRSLASLAVCLAVSQSCSIPVAHLQLQANRLLAFLHHKRVLRGSQPAASSSSACGLQLHDAACLLHHNLHVEGITWSCAMASASGCIQLENTAKDAEGASRGMICRAWQRQTSECWHGQLMSRVQGVCTVAVLALLQLTSSTGFLATQLMPGPAQISAGAAQRCKWGSTGSTLSSSWACGRLGLASMQQSHPSARICRVVAIYCAGVTCNHICSQSCESLAATYVLNDSDSHSPPHVVCCPLAPCQLQQAVRWQPAADVAPKSHSAGVLQLASCMAVHLWLGGPQQLQGPGLLQLAGGPWQQLHPS